jgi:hypothetical protein
MNSIGCSILAPWVKAKDDFGCTRTCKIFPSRKKLEAVTCRLRFSISNRFKWIHHVLDWHVVCPKGNTTRNEHLR